jgi:hypothetical protein
MDEKVELLRKVAALVGVSLDDVLGTGRVLEDEQLIAIFFEAWESAIPRAKP